MQIRYLDTIASMAKSGNAKVIFVPASAAGGGTAGGGTAFPDMLQSSITSELAQGGGV
jgi:ribulose 1,5-bisphosphate synthetase/thiazole synthase